METKLYPPQIAGSLPAFYKNYDKVSTSTVRGATIKVPFTMNQGVGYAQIDGFAIRIRNCSSNEYVCPVEYSRNYDFEESTVTFDIDPAYAERFEEGQFYKVQLAYYAVNTQVTDDLGIKDNIAESENKNNFLTGYYSTVGIIKCVSYPSVRIENYSSESVNLFTGEVFGIYDQTNSLDQTEKVYSYNFAFYDANDDLYFQTEEFIHNVNNDVNYNYSTDSFVINDFIKNNEVFKVVYTVTTMNGLVVSSPRYKITSNALLAPNKHIDIILLPNNDNGYIRVTYKGITVKDEDDYDKEDSYYGEYILSRACENDGYTEWSPLLNFRLANQKPSERYFDDFAVEQGVKYKYSLQQYNMWGLYSSRLISEPCSIDFEDMFLYDGERSLKIRFNPKVSSFKTTLLEQKVETIGSKYPFIFRNGTVAYKEFPIEGLISWQMDDERRFYLTDYDKIIRRTESSKEGVQEFDEEGIFNHFDLVEENILKERKFKLAVLDWLNNGKPKMFKSGTEGNYIVELMKVSLKPVDKLGRMLHSFKATAYEIADYTYANLIKYGFVGANQISKYVSLWKTYDLAKMDGNRIVFEQEVSRFSISDMIPGTKVYVYYEHSSVPEVISIGVTGSYTFEGSTRKVTSLVIEPPDGVPPQGSIECEYIGLRYSDFDSITSIALKTIVSNQFIGVNPLEIAFEESARTFDEKYMREVLINTQYRTLLNKYDISKKENRIQVAEDLGLYPGIEGKYQFSAGDTIHNISSSFYDDEKVKIKILNMEQLKLRVRELIPVYAVPPEYVAPEDFKRFDKDYSRGDYYNRNDVSPKRMLVSTTPFGTPYPIDKLLDIFNVKFKDVNVMNDPYCIFAIYEYIPELSEWKLMDNQNHIAGIDFQGHYYDPYYDEMTFNYDTTFYIESNKRYVVVDVEDIPSGQQIYIIKDGEYIPTSDTSNSNLNYYIQVDNRVDLKYDKEMYFENLGEVSKLVIGNGVIAEETFQLEIIDYYTEQNDPNTKKAKDAYLEAAAYLRGILEAYEAIEEADIGMKKYQALYKAYYILLQGTNHLKEADKMTEMNFFTLLGCLNNQMISKEQLAICANHATNDLAKDAINNILEASPNESFFNLVDIINQIMIKNNYSETALEASKRVMLLIINDIETKPELHLIDDIEENQLLSLITNDSIEGLSVKDTKLLSLIDSISEFLAQKAVERAEVLSGMLDTKEKTGAMINNYNIALTQFLASSWVYYLLQGLPYETPEDKKKANDTVIALFRYYNALYGQFSSKGELSDKTAQSLLTIYRRVYNEALGLLEDVNTFLTIQDDDNIAGSNLDNYITSTVLEEKTQNILVDLYQLNQIYNFLKPRENDLIDYTQEIADQPILILTNDAYKTWGLNQLKKIISKAKIQESIIESYETSEDYGKNEKWLSTSKDFVILVDYIVQMKAYSQNNMTYLNTTSLTNDIDQLINKQEDILKVMSTSDIMSIDRPILSIVTDIDKTELPELKITISEEQKYLGDRESNVFQDRLGYVVKYLNDINFSLSNSTNVITDLKSFLESKYKTIKNLDAVKARAKELNDIISILNDQYIVIYGTEVKNPEVISNEKWIELMTEFTNSFSIPLDTAIYSFLNQSDSIENIKYPSVEANKPSVPTNTISDYDLYNLPKVKINFISVTTKDDARAQKDMGIFYWYMNEIFDKQIEEQRNLLDEMNALHLDYQYRLNNYYQKYSLYKDRYTNSYTTYNGYREKNPKQYNYYSNSTEGKDQAMNTAIKEVHDTWNNFILALDKGYAEEIARGMYG